MKLLLTGLMPWWGAVLLVVALTTGTVLVYRRQRLAPPWTRILPGLRIAAFILLCLGLLQPVLSRVHRDVQRGRIVVLADNSGSMSVADEYLPAEAVRLAWGLDWFKRDLRRLDFEQATGRVGEVRGLLVEAAGGGGRALDRAAGLLAEMTTDLHRVIVRSEYLSNATRPRAAGSGLTWQLYKGISGITVDDLRRDGKFPLKPDETLQIERFETRQNAGDNFGSRVTGFLRVPVAGDYRFHLTTDDGGELLVSLNGDPSAAESLLRTDGYRNWDDWGPESRAVRLEAGQIVYVEALAKEQGSSDHLRVGWTRPDGKQERPIGREHLFIDDPRRNAEDWQNVWTHLQTDAAQLAEEFGSVNREGASAAGSGGGVAAPATDRLNTWAERTPELERSLLRLQELADEALASAGIVEVDAALRAVRATSRWDLVRIALTNEPLALLSGFSARGDVRLHVLADEPTPLDAAALTGVVAEVSATRLGSTAEQVLRAMENEPVAGLVLLTDGNNNAGQTLGELHKLARERRIPLQIVAVGSTNPPNDVAVESVLAPATSFKGDRLGVTANLSRKGFAKRQITVKVLSGGQVRREVKVPPGAEERVAVDLSFVEDKEGQHNYVVEVEEFEREALAVNNKRTFPVVILQDPIRSLIVDEFPRWESRYVRMMLARDKRMAPDVVFVGSQEGGTLRTGPGKYPETRDALFAYQVVVLGDVDPRHFSTRQMEDLRDFVLERGGTLILLAGEHHMPGAFRGTPLDAVMPVQPRGASDALPEWERKLGAVAIPLELTDEGRHDGASQIGRTPEESEKLWKTLPGLNWVSSNAVAARAADPIARSTEGEMPVVVKAHAGAGKVLFLGSDSFWRWRNRVRWAYHHRFWGELLLWATLERTTGSDAFVKLMTDRLTYEPGETVRVRARVQDERQLPIDKAQVSIEVFDDRNTLQRQAVMFPAGSGGGEYVCELTALPRGRYRLSPKVFELRDKPVQAAVEIEVGDVGEGEYVDLAVKDAIVSQFTDRYLRLADAAGVHRSIEPVELALERREDSELWDTFAFQVLAALLLGLEWQLRKRKRLA